MNVRKDRQTGTKSFILTVNRRAFIKPPSEPVRIWFRTATAEGNTRLKSNTASHLGIREVNKCGTEKIGGPQE